MNNSVAEVLRIVRRRRGASGEGVHDNEIRLSGTSTRTLIAADDKDQAITNAVVRGGNDYPTPDGPRSFVINTANGDRLQDFANTHLSEGETPGRIPRMFNNRISGKTGRGITGQRTGDDFLTLGVSGSPDVGVGDGKYMQHVQIPRGQVVARAFARTVDDAANVPAIYVSDPTRR